jgi:hypothetical protein
MTADERAASARCRKRWRSCAHVSAQSKDKELPPSAPRLPSRAYARLITRYCRRLQQAREAAQAIDDMHPSVAMIGTGR